MTGPNGNAQQSGLSRLNGPPTDLSISAAQSSRETVRARVRALEVPFEPSLLEWRVMNPTKSQPLRGQVVPYADQRDYTDRLNGLFTPAGWTRRYAVHTSASFERSKDQKIVAKILLTCELTIFGLGSHSATGEEWADDDNAGTAAEAQAFKRASAGNGQQNNNGEARNTDILREIERMEKIIGKRMYRGLRKSVASDNLPQSLRRRLKPREKEVGNLRKLRSQKAKHWERAELKQL